MAEIEVKEQCKKCFHFQVCANVLKQQLYIREKMLKEENPKCDYFIPTADVVLVVRCCNCIHLKTNTDKENYCDIHSTTWDKFYVRLDDYCSYGERRCSDEKN